MIHLDTTFLVDLLRESARRSPGPATRFLESHADETFAASLFVRCELAASAQLSRDAARETRRVDRVLDAVTSPELGDPFVATYGRLLAKLQASGTRLGTTDLLIGSAALSEGCPILTRNTKDFERIPGLEVLTY